MKRSTDRILTTHVGSLIRPPEVLAFAAAHADGKRVDDAAETATLKSAVAEVVRQQVEHGVDIVSDGEFGKSTWFTYIMERLGGYDVRPTTPPTVGVRGLDEVRFREYFAQDDSFNSIGIEQHVAVAPITYTGRAAMQRDVDNFKAALQGQNVEGAFLPVVAPTSVSVDHVNEYYKSHEEYLFALGDAMREEYKIITDAGLIVQLDDAILTHWWDAMNEDGRDYLKWVDQQVEVINHALKGIPEDQVRYHLCWGSWPGPHLSDVPLRAIADKLMKINAQGYSIEAANPRHEWEWTVWEDVKLPEGKILIPGVISHATTHVEHPELIAQRLTRLGNLVGFENVIASSDCGFAQGWMLQRQHPSIMWAKLDAMAEGARLTSRQLQHA